MFGHRKGAFTGADRDKPGLLETANGGTLFLDELTEMSMPLQAKLLRVIQDGVVRRVGSEQQDAVVDVRFVSATNREPQEAVDAGSAAGRPVLPAAGGADQAAPAAQAAGGHPAAGQPLPDLLLAAASPDGRPGPAPERGAASAFLRSRPWRGNVRELQNVIEHVAVLAEPEQLIQPNDIPRLRRCAGVARRRAPFAAGVHGRGLPSREGSRRRPVREGVSHAAGQPRRRQHVQGRAARRASTGPRCIG